MDGAAGTFGNIAEIIGPTLQPTSSSCQLQFYYHMLGVGKHQETVVNSHWSNFYAPNPLEMVTSI